MGNVFRVINCDGDIEISIYKKANAVFKTNEYNEIEDVCIHKEIINIFDLLKENQELKSQLKGTTHCFDEEEHRKLKDEIKKIERIIELCHLDAKETLATINYEHESQQKEFINYLEEEIYSIEPKGTGIIYNCEYDSEEDYVNAMKEQSRLNTLKEALQNCKSIIGENDV